MGRHTPAVVEFEAAVSKAFPRGYMLDMVGTEYTWSALGRWS